MSVAPPHPLGVGLRRAGAVGHVGREVLVEVCVLPAPPAVDGDWLAPRNHPRRLAVRYDRHSAATSGEEKS